MVGPVPGAVPPGAPGVSPLGAPGLCALLAGSLRDLAARAALLLLLIVSLKSAGLEGE